MRGITFYEARPKRESPNVNERAYKPFYAQFGKSHFKLMFLIFLNEAEKR
jgi:hypothetical protein